MKGQARFTANPKSVLQIKPSSNTVAIATGMLSVLPTLVRLIFLIFQLQVVFFFFFLLRAHSLIIPIAYFTLDSHHALALLEMQI